jgi:hypothetical protein
MVLAGIGIIVNLTGTNTDLTHQAVLTEQVKGVVDGGLRYPPQTLVTKFLNNLVGTEMLRLRKEKLRDFDPLSGGIYLLALQQLDCFVLIQNITLINVRIQTAKYIPVILENAGMLAALTHPNHLVYLRSWGFTRLPPICISNDFGYS